MFGVISTRCLRQKQAFLAIKRHDMAKSQQKNESSSCKFKIKFEYRFDPKRINWSKDRQILLVLHNEMQNIQHFSLADRTQQIFTIVHSAMQP
jgi:hypothetical protein